MQNNILNILESNSLVFFDELNSCKKTSAKNVTWSAAMVVSTEMVELIYAGGRHSHRDLGIHIERACSLHGAKMTRHKLLHKG